MASYFLYTNLYQESQDLTKLVQYCNAFSPSSGEAHPVDVVVKSPFLAMKYPKTAQTVSSPLTVNMTAD